MKDRRAWVRSSAGVLASMVVFTLSVGAVPLNVGDVPAAVSPAAQPQVAPAAVPTVTPASAPTLNWIQWTAPASYPKSATWSSFPYTYAESVNGSITLPNGSMVYVTFTGEIAAASTSDPPSGFGVPGNTYWANRPGSASGAAYKSTNVPDWPTNGDRIGVVGANPGGVQAQMLSFYSDEARTVPFEVSNIVMVMYSLGRSNSTGTWDFSQNFDILSQNGPPLTALEGLSKPASSGPYRLTGREGTGTLQFTGTFSSISWNVVNPEFFATWNIGVTSAPPPSEPALTPSTSSVSGLTGTAITPITLTPNAIEGTITYSVKSGTLPAGLTLNPSTGEITGTPTEPGTASVVIEATGSTSGVAETTIDFEFSAPEYAVTFDANGGGGSMTGQSSSSATELAPNAFVREGYTFAGWNTSADGTGTPYADGASYPFDGAVTLYAQWTADTHTITFDTGDGDPVPPGSYETDSPVTLPPAPRREGFEFIGWFLAPEGGEPLVDGFIPPTPGPITIYAQWRPVVMELAAAPEPVSESRLPVTGASVVPMFVGSLTAILFGFAMLVSAGQVRPAWATRLATARVDLGKRRRRSTRPATAPLAFVDTVVEPRVDVLRPVPPVPVARPVVPMPPPVERPVAPVPVVIRSRALVEAEPVVVPEAIVVESAPAVTSVPGWMRAQAVMAAQLADDWSAADRVTSAAQVAALRARLRQLDGVAGERAAMWRARLMGELDRLAADEQD